jgi:hypothetical protein
MLCLVVDSFDADGQDLGQQLGGAAVGSADDHRAAPPAHAEERDLGAVPGLDHVPSDDLVAVVVAHDVRGHVSSPSRRR